MMLYELDLFNVTDYSSQKCIEGKLTKQFSSFSFHFSASYNKGMNMTMSYLAKIAQNSKIHLHSKSNL